MRFRPVRLREIGLFKLGNLRAAAGFAASVFLALGIEASTDDNHHRLMTYLVWYGLSAVLVAFAIAATVVIERRKRVSDRAVAIDELRATAATTPQAQAAVDSKARLRELEAKGGELASDFVSASISHGAQLIMDKHGPRFRIDHDAVDRSSSDYDYILDGYKETVAAWTEDVARTLGRISTDLADEFTKPQWIVPLASGLSGSEDWNRLSQELDERLRRLRSILGRI